MLRSAPDVPRAQALWESYVNEKCSGQASKCPPVLYAYSYPTPSIEWLLRQWRAALPGITIILYDGCHTQVCKLRPYHLGLAGWGADYPDPQDFLSLLVHTGSPYNQMHISLPAADALLDAADMNSDPVARLAQYQQAEQELVNAVAWIPLSQGLNVYLVRPRVAGGYHERASAAQGLAVWQRIYLIKV